MDIPSVIATETAITRQNVAMSTIKANADQAQAMAEILEESVTTAPVNKSRGTYVDFKV